MALVVAALLGVLGGITTAIVAPHGFRGVDQPQPSPSTTEPPADRLGLGVPLVNVACTGQILIMVGWGDVRPALSPSVADYDRDGVKYLDTRRSCQTAYPSTRGGVPRYVAYLPAYDTFKAACGDRMTARHKGDFVSRMRRGNEVGVQCACELELSVLPSIGEGQDLTTESGVWISLYQGMLNDVGTKPAVPTSGRFDEATITATRTLQTDAALSPTAIVDADTWNVLRNQACSGYDY